MECKTDNKESYYRDGFKKEWTEWTDNESYYWDGFRKEWMECKTDNKESYYRDGFKKEWSGLIIRRVIIGMGLRKTDGVYD